MPACAAGATDNAISAGSVSFFISLALADVLFVRSDERSLRALHVAQARALRHELVGAARGRRVAEAGVERLRRVERAEEGDHAGQVDAAARYGDRAG